MPLAGNQIQLPGVETTWDFGKWESNIRNCPFLDPITEEEVDLYIRFLETNDDSHGDDWQEWQNYEEIIGNYRDDEEDTSSIPEWYQFYNLYKGTASLMLLLLKKPWRACLASPLIFRLS